MAKDYTDDPYNPYTDPYASPDLPGPRPGLPGHKTPPQGRPPDPPGPRPGYPIDYPPPGAPPGKGHWDNGVWVMENGHYDDSGKWIQDPGSYDDAGNFVPAPPPGTVKKEEDGGLKAPEPPPGGGAQQNTVQDVYNNTITTLLNSNGSNGTNAAASSYQAPGTGQVNKTSRPYDAALNAQILRLLTGPTAEEVGAAAGSSAPVNAFRNSQMRDLEKARAGAAEMAGVQGTDQSGGFEGRIQGLQQAAGENVAKYAGDYTRQAMADRRAELHDAMLMAQDQGQFDDAQALQLEIAKMDEALRRYSTDVQRELGLGDLGLRKFLGIMQDSTERYGIDTTAGTADKNRDFEYWAKMLEDAYNKLKALQEGGK